MKYKIIQFKNIWRCVPSSHNASIAARLLKTFNGDCKIYKFIVEICTYICYFFVAGGTPPVCSDRETFLVESHQQVT